MGRAYDMELFRRYQDKNILVVYIIGLITSIFLAFQVEDITDTLQFVYYFYIFSFIVLFSVSAFFVLRLLRTNKVMCINRILTNINFILLCSAISVQISEIWLNHIPATHIALSALFVIAAFMLFQRMEFLKVLKGAKK